MRERRREGGIERWSWRRGDGGNKKEIENETWREIKRVTRERWRESVYV